MSLIGSTIGGRYKVVEEIARGGFAIVYRGLDIRLHHAPVAIKHLRPQLAEKPEVLAMFQAEIRISSRLQYPSIVRVLDTVQEGENHFVVFEFVDGTDLRRLALRAKERPESQYATESGQRIPPYLTAYVLREVCYALDYAHGLEDTESNMPMNIVHRDVSPANVLISYTGDVKLTDFGIAKAREQMTEETRVGVVKGKYSYMSPEQVRGQSLDHTSDLYSLGIVLYETLAGEKLYPQKTEAELIARVAKGGVDKRQLNSTAVPKGLRDVLEKALRVNRNRRYQSGIEMAEDLTRFLEGHYGLRQELAFYVQTMFKPHLAESTEVTETMHAEEIAKHGTPVVDDLASQESAASRGGLQAVAKGEQVPEGERTIIDIIKIAAYSGRRAFTIGALVLAGLLVVFVGADTFVPELWPELGWRRTPIGRWVFYKLFPPSVVIVSYPPGAEVQLDGKLIEERAPARSRLAPAHSYDLVLKLNHYKSIHRKISINPERGRGEIDTMSFSFVVPVEIKTSPPGATVLLNGRERGVTPLPLEDEQITPDDIAVELRYAEFKPLKGSMNLGTQRLTEDMFLQIQPSRDKNGRIRWQVNGKFYADVTIKATPKDASLTLDDKQIQLDKNGEVRRSVCYGDHRLVLARHGFNTRNNKLRIESGEPQTLRISLTRTVRVYVTDADGDRISGKVTIHGIRKSSGSPFYLGLGSHSVKVSAPGYQTRNISIRVTTQSNPSIYIALERGKAETTIIVLDRDGKPVEGIWVVARDQAGKDVLYHRTGPSGKIVTNELEGRYQFRMTKDGAPIKSGWYDIQWGQPNKIELIYE